MFALRFSQFGAHVLHVQDIEQPVVRQGEVLVEVHAVCRPQSQRCQKCPGGDGTDDLAQNAGRDFAGVVVEGPQEEIGKPVWGTGGDLVSPAMAATHSISCCRKRLSLRSQPIFRFLRRLRLE